MKMKPKVQRKYLSPRTSRSEAKDKVLPIFVELGRDALPLPGIWRSAFSRQGENDRFDFSAMDYDDSGWDEVQLPHLESGTAGRDTLWYRCRFNIDEVPSRRRLLLRFGGSFYNTRVWLNGILLGEHEGYFQPFGFDITDHCQPGENILAVSSRFPVEAGAFKRKTAVAGIFADWDCKPYPSAFYPDLPEPYEWAVPVGLWEPVQLYTSSPILVETLNVYPQLDVIDWSPPVPRAESAEVKVEISLRNLSTESHSIPLTANLTPYNFTEAVRETKSLTVALSGDEILKVEFSIPLTLPRLWFPWTHGDAWLYRVQLEVGEVETECFEKVFGIREVRAVIGEDRWEWWLNGRRIFPKGSNYISDFFLDQATPERLQGDIELARQANLDLLRVHAHIEPQAFYRLCDEMGMLVFCDFPLIWTYAYNLPEDEKALFEAVVLGQVGDMVSLLGSHPSIVLWSIHNEPPWSPSGEFLGNDVHLTETNRELDHAAADAVKALDETRPVIPASGEFDPHLYHGWYTGSWPDNRELQPPFPSEFGVQALPDRDSPVWEKLHSRWPVDPEDPNWAYAGYQSVFWASPGIGLPAQFASLEDYIAESQAYQSFYIRYVIDQWRKRKFTPIGGYIHHLFTDASPAITWSVLDYARLPKSGYFALAEASRPVRLALDIEDGFTIEKTFHILYQEGGILRIGMFLVNDDYRREGQVSVRWWLEKEGEGQIREFVRRNILSRSLQVELPDAGSGALPVQRVEIPLEHPGRYVFRTEVKQDGEVLDENRVELRVGDKARRPRMKRRIPRFLVNKVYRPGSLENKAGGFTFQLHNPAMTVSVIGIRAFHLDQSPVDPSQIEVLSGAQNRNIRSIDPQNPFEFHSKSNVEIFVRGAPLMPGEHSLEVTVEVEGFGSLTAEIRDYLK
jgi:beta-mannosidase